jgi:hypothetical protein
MIKTLSFLAAIIAAFPAFSAGNCQPAAMLVETQQTSPLSNEGTAYINVGNEWYEGVLKGTVVAYDPVTYFPTRIRYRFVHGGNVLVLIGRPVLASYAPLTFDSSGYPVKALLDINVSVASGTLGGVYTSSSGIVFTGVFDVGTTFETFVSNKVGAFCK